MICDVDRFGTASCVCPQCPADAFVTPVCVSDGVTYSSECHFTRSKCLHHHQQQRQRQSQYQSLHLLHHPDHQNSVNSSHNQQHLFIQEIDLMTPDNKSQTEAVIVHAGACRGSQGRSSTGNPVPAPVQPDLCARTTCPFSGVCQVEENLKGIVSCRCPDCTDDKQPVCGSDRKTYTNECFLRKQSCERQAMISVLHEGHCRQCQDMNCSHYSTCQITAAGTEECLCPQCPLPGKKPVCGSNGLTYESECELQMKSCESRVSIAVWKDGPCGELISDPAPLLLPPAASVQIVEFSSHLISDIYSSFRYPFLPNHLSLTLLSSLVRACVYVSLAVYFRSSF